MARCLSVESSLRLYLIRALALSSQAFTGRSLPKQGGEG